MVNSPTAKPLGQNSLRLLVTDRAWPDLAIERQILEPAGVEIVEAQSTDEETLCGLAIDIDAIVCNWGRVTARVIEAATRCRLISRSGIGLDNIDLAAATARGIPVTNVPDYCVGEVSDHAMALLLACARRVAQFHATTKQGQYNLQAVPPPARLTGKVLGLVGLGRIGREMARKGAAFGMKVVGYSASGNDHGLGIEMLSLPELLHISDFVSLHAPATPATRYLISRPQFESMKPGAWLINTSRGSLVNEADLWEALQGNRIAGAALDVFDPEPPDLMRPLFRDERVLVTPHAAFVSPESLVELRTRVAHQVLAVFRGEFPENIVNGISIRHQIP